MTKIRTAMAAAVLALLSFGGTVAPASAALKDPIVDVYASTSRYAIGGGELVTDVFPLQERQNMPLSAALEYAYQFCPPAPTLTKAKLKDLTQQLEADRILTICPFDPADITGFVIMLVPDNDTSALPPDDFPQG